MKHHRSASLYGIFVFLSLVFILGFPNSHAQDATATLDGKLSQLIERLESKQADEPEAKAATAIARQLKFALSEGNPSLISNRGRLPLGKYQTEIENLIRQVTQEASLKATAKKEQWARQVDAYLQKVEQACIKGTPTGQLEALLAAGDDVARLAPMTSRSSYGRSGDEATKLNAAIQLLQQWLVYKRLDEKGYANQARDKLKSLISSTRSYPILDKAFLDKKIAGIDKILAKEEQKLEGEKNVSAIQAKALKKLEENKLNASLLGEVVDAMAPLPYNHNVTTNYNMYLAIQALADCFHFVEIEDPVKGRDKLSDFVRISFSAHQLQKIRKKAVFQLTPILYKEIGAKAPKADQRESRYIYELIRTPTSIEEATVRSDLIGYYHYLSPNTKSLRGGEVLHWKEPAQKQFALLASAGSALKSKDHAFALKQLRAAQELAPLSGPANASALIKAELEKLRELEPKLFESSVSVMAIEIGLLQKEIDRLKTEAAKLREKARRFP